MTHSGIPDGALRAPGAATPRASDLLAPQRVRAPLHSREKEGVLRELVDLVVDSRGLGAERGAVYQAVLEREKALSTGIGDGIALPHAKYQGLSDLVMAAGVAARPVDYGALDGQDVALFFLILGPDSAAAAHVRVLARVSRLMRDGSLRRRLVSAKDAEEFLRILAEAERAN